MISTDSTDNPKLGAKVLSDGRESLFLDYYLGFVWATSSKSGKEYKRVNTKREYLKMYLLKAPKTKWEKEQNRETLDIAKKIRFEMSQRLSEDKTGYRLRKKQVMNFLDYFQIYIDKYNKKDIAMMRLARQRFIDFLNDTPEYQMFANGIKAEQLTRDMIEDFTDYLQTRSKGGGAKAIYAHFKKVIKYAVEHDDMVKDPCKGISIKIDNNILRKEILSPGEIKRLVATRSNEQNPNIRRAFVFCLQTGMRFCDVKDLTFASVDYSNKLLKYEQNKTKGHSSSSGVVVPLRDDMLRLIGEPPENGGRDALIFPLPCYSVCLRALQRWVKRAGIPKHISWHCARHSFAVNLLNAGVNPKVVSELLGHSSMAMTEKYLRAVDSLKVAAVNSLPSLVDF